MRFHWPQRTVRLRLTMLYGALFLVSGTVLLAITYVLMLHSSAVSGVERGPNGELMVGTAGTTPPEQQLLGVPANMTQDQLQARMRQLQDLATQQRESDLRQLVVQSGIALAVMAVLSIALGWLVAGRLLRRLRTITQSAQDISASNLHERLALDGPDDELKQLGDTFDGLLERLAASFESQRQFVANASHELRTPLARQRTLGQLALADPDADTESLRAAHERILAAGKQQERLIEALLTLASSEGGLNRRELVDLASVTDQVVLARHGEAQQRGLHLVATTDPALTPGDPGLIERLVTNLLDNAVKYNVAQGQVDIATSTRSGRAVLSVSNTGPLVPATETNRLFQPFQRLDTDRTCHDGGYGLGLSIVQAIATAHNADIAATARPTGGLEITVTFPGAPPDRLRQASRTRAWENRFMPDT